MHHLDRRTFLAAITTSVSLLSTGRLSAQSPRLRCTSDSTIDPTALNLPKGPFGTCINGQTFQQEAIVTFAKQQYATWFADGGILCVGRRALGEGKWEVIRFDDYRIKHNDVHNVSVIGICPADGSIHLAFDHHNHPLHYRCTKAGAAQQPGQFKWEPALFGPTTDSLEAGKPIKGLTYPMFFPTPQGRLQLVYRLGGSGAGDWYLAEYDGTAWKLIGELFSRKGTYQTSPSRCAYPNPFRYGPGDRLHVTWCWRERPAGVKFDLTTNHDLCYAYSDDLGRTWKNNSGEVVGKLGERPIHVDSPGIVVQKIPMLRGQMNTTTQYVDSRGRMHAINWQLPSEAAAPNMDMNQWRYDHYWRDEKGAWQANRLPFHGRKPQIVLDDKGGALVVFCRGKDHNYHDVDPGGDLCIAAAHESTAWKDWQIIHEQKEWSVGEPLIDIGRWQRDRVLSIYVQTAPKTPGAASALRVLEFAV